MKQKRVSKKAAPKPLEHLLKEIATYGHEVDTWLSMIEKDAVRHRKYAAIDRAAGSSLDVMGVDLDSASRALGDAAAAYNALIRYGLAVYGKKKMTKAASLHKAAAAVTKLV
jgi:hypothetical protein